MTKRVFEVAKEYGVQTKEVIQALANKNIKASNFTGVDDKMKESYDKIINALKDTYKISETEAISLADMSNSDFVTYYYKIEAYGEAVK